MPARSHADPDRIAKENLMPPNPSSLPTRAAMYAALMGFRSVWQTRGPGTSNADVWKHDDERGIGLGECRN
jgi:hypothetical protein